MSDAGSDQVRIHDLLEEFLHEESERRGKGITLEALHEKVDAYHQRLDASDARVGRLAEKIDAIYTTVNRSATQQIKTYETVRRYGRRIAALENVVSLITSRSPSVEDWEPNPSEITGTHQFEKIRAEQEALRKRVEDEEERRRDSGIWWHRQRWLWIGIIVCGLVVAGIAGCVGYAASQFTPSLKRSIHQLRAQ